jgi:hypothetical protein
LTTSTFCAKLKVAGATTATGAGATTGVEVAVDGLLTLSIEAKTLVGAGAALAAGEPPPIRFNKVAFWGAAGVAPLRWASMFAPATEDTGSVGAGVVGAAALDPANKAELSNFFIPLEELEAGASLVEDEAEERLESFVNSSLSATNVIGEKSNPAGAAGAAAGALLLDKDKIFAKSVTEETVAGAVDGFKPILARMLVPPVLVVGAVLRVSAGGLGLAVFIAAIKGFELAIDTEALLGEIRDFGITTGELAPLFSPLLFPPPTLDNKAIIVLSLTFPLAPALGVAEAAEEVNPPSAPRAVRLGLGVYLEKSYKVFTRMKYC